MAATRSRSWSATPLTFAAKRHSLLRDPRFTSAAFKDPASSSCSGLFSRLASCINCNPSAARSPERANGWSNPPAASSASSNCPQSHPLQCGQIAARRVRALRFSDGWAHTDRHVQRPARAAYPWPSATVVRLHQYMDTAGDLKRPFGYFRCSAICCVRRASWIRLVC
jgi:hypothetical protein